MWIKILWSFTFIGTRKKRDGIKKGGFSLINIYKYKIYDLKMECTIIVK
jgi:hypothetical protein